MLKLFKSGPMLNYLYSGRDVIARNFFRKCCRYLFNLSFFFVCNTTCKSYTQHYNL